MGVSISWMFYLSLLFKWTTGWFVLINARCFILSLFMLCLKHAIPLFSLYSGIMVFGAAALLWRVCLNKVMGGDLIIILSGSQSKEIKSNRLVNDQRSLQIVSGQRRAPSVAIWLSIIFVWLMPQNGKRIYAKSISLTGTERGHKLGLISLPVDVMKRRTHKKNSANKKLSTT